MRFIEPCPCCVAAKAEAEAAPESLPRRAWLRRTGAFLALSATACSSQSPYFNAEPRREGEPEQVLSFGFSPPAPSPRVATEARAPVASGPARILRVRRGATGDSFAGTYWRDGRYDREALAKLNQIFRDPGRDETTPMDPRLFDVLHILANRLGSTEHYDLLSGYRTPETNAANASRSRRVSRVSLHMSGMAADVRLPDRSPLGLARLAAEMQTGGVGLYRSGFVHLDCGPARRW